MHLADRLIRPVFQSARLAALMVAMGTVVARAALMPPVDSVELVATGDRIDDLGRVGYPGISVNGIDGDGRVLFTGRLSDGRVALFFGDGSGVRALWESAPGDPLLRVDEARINEAGQVLAPTALSDYPLSTEALFEVREDGLYSLVEVGDTTAEGDLICGLGEFAANETGGVAVSALVGAPRTDCDAFDVTSAVYLLGDGRPRRVAELSNSSPARLADLTDGGFAVIASIFDTLVYATDGTSVRPLLDSGQTGPSGEPFQVVSVTQVNDAGQVLLQGYDLQSVGIYLATEGILRPIVTRFDLAPWGDPIAFAGDAGFDGSGNVIVSIASSPVNEAVASDDGYGIVRYAQDGSETLIARGAYQPRVNQAGQIAALQEGTGAPDVLRWTGDESVQIVDGDAKAPNGAWYASGGIGGACLAADGRVGAAVNVTQSQAGFICTDSSGLHTVASTEDGSDFAFKNFFQCAFAGEDFLFAATDGEPGEFVESTLGIFRADFRGLCRVIGPGDRIADGSSVQRLRFDFGGELFAINDRGSIVVPALTDRGVSLLRLREGAALESVLAGSTEPFFDQIVDAAIAADDTAIAILGISDDGSVDGDGPRVVVASDGSDSRVLATTGDATLPGGPYVTMYDLRASGDLVWFIGVDSDGAVRVLQYDLSASHLREVPLPGAEEGGLALGSVSASGRVLYSTYDSNARAQVYRIADADGAVELLSQADARLAERLLAFDDSGHVLFSVEQSSLGAQRTSLNLSGAEATVACPALGESSAGAGNDGCQITASGDASIWPLLGGLFLFLARRRDQVSASRG